MNPPQRRVAVIATGGTIDSVGVSRLDLASYHETGGRLGPGALISSVPELAQVAAIDEIPFRRVSSSALTTGDWLALARTVQELVSGEDHDGVVVTHGTNTLEETGFFLHLTLGSPKPVVLVGAMRPSNALGADGGLNVLRAVQVAASDEARGLGVLAVLNDTIFSARDVTKGDTYRVNAFRAPDAGPLGHADADGRVVIRHRPAVSVEELPPFDLEPFEALPRVDVVVSYVGADGAAIDAFVAAGARGIVSAGSGAGRVTPAEEDALSRATDAGVVVCQASRVGGGRVVPSPRLAQRRIVAAGDLQPWKARVLLALALTQSLDFEQVQALFDRA